MSTDEQVSERLWQAEKDAGLPGASGYGETWDAQPCREIYRAQAAEVERIVAERVALVEAEHGELRILTNWDECPVGEEGGHEPGEGHTGDMLCWTCPEVATVCFHCHDEYGEAREWPCPTIAAIRTRPGARP